MNHEDLLRQRYLRRFKIGIVILTLLAIPAIIHSHAAIESLFNRTSDWIPNTVPEKIEFDDFVTNFSAADLIMIAWEGSDLSSDSLAAAALALRPLVEPDQSRDADEAAVREAVGKQQTDDRADDEIDSQLPAKVVDIIARLRSQTGLKYRLKWL